MPGTDPQSGIMAIVVPEKEACSEIPLWKASEPWHSWLFTVSTNGLAGTAAITGQ